MYKQDFTVNNLQGFIRQQPTNQPTIRTIVLILITKLIY